VSETQDFADAGELDSDLVAADLEDTDDEIEIEDEIADESADFAQEDDDEFDEDEDDEDSEDESDDSSSLERADDNDDDDFEDDDEFDDDDDSEESVVEVAVPAGPVFALESLPVTGEARVDDALGRLGDLEGLPVSEHPAVFEDVQRRLHDTLADLAGS
jgi:hypothetical protein